MKCIGSSSRRLWAAFAAVVCCVVTVLCAAVIGFGFTRAFAAEGDITYTASVEVKQKDGRVFTQNFTREQALQVLDISVVYTPEVADGEEPGESKVVPLTLGAFNADGTVTATAEEFNGVSTYTVSGIVAYASDRTMNITVTPAGGTAIAAPEFKYTLGNRTVNGITAVYANNGGALTNVTEANPSMFNVGFTYNDGSVGALDMETTSYSVDINLFPDSVYKPDGTLYQDNDTYSKLVKVTYNDNTNYVAYAEVKGIVYQAPTGIGDELRSTLPQLQLVARSDFDRSDITVSVKYRVNNRVTTRDVPLSAFASDCVTSAYYDNEYNEYDTLSTEVSRLYLTFTYPGEPDWIAEGDISVFVAALPIHTPKFPTAGAETVLAWDNGAEIDISEWDYASLFDTDPPDPVVSVRSSNGANDNYVIGTPDADGKINLKFLEANGVRYTVSVTLEGGDNADFQWSAVGGNGGSKLENAQTIEYVIQVNKGKPTATLDGTGADYGTTYGDTAVSGSVTVTIGDEVITTLDTFGFSGAACATADKDGENRHYHLEYTAAASWVDISGTTHAANEWAAVAPRNAGTYSVRAVTHENKFYYSATSAALSFTIEKREITFTNLGDKTYTRGTTWTLTDFISVGSSFVYGETFDEVLTVMRDGVTFAGISHAGAYTVKVSVKSSYSTNYFIAAGADSPEFKVVTREFGMAATASGWTYGATTAGPSPIVTWQDAAGATLTDPADVYPQFASFDTKYYAADGAGNPTGSALSTADSDWAKKLPVGKYVAVLTALKDTAYADETTGAAVGTDVDYTLPTANATFEVVAGAIKKVSIASPWSDSGSYGQVAVYGNALTVNIVGWADAVGAVNNTTADGKRILEISVDGKRFVSGNGISDNVSVDNVNGSLTIMEAGEYIVTITLNSNYLWDTESNNSPVVYYGKIVKQQLGAVSVNYGAKDVYDATTQSKTISGWNNVAMKISAVTAKTIDGKNTAITSGITFNSAPVSGVYDNAFNVTEAGEYSVKIDVVDPDNYEWADTADTAAKTLTYTHKQAPFKVKWYDKTGGTVCAGTTDLNNPTVRYDFDEDKAVQAYPVYETDVYARDGITAAGNFAIYKNGTVVSGNRVTEVGIYSVVVRGFSGAGAHNYYLPSAATGDAQLVTIVFEIVSKGLNKPTLVTNGIEGATVNNAAGTISVVYRGAGYKFSDFIDGYASYVVGGVNKLVITVDGAGANDRTVTDVKLSGGSVAAYTVTVKPAGNYSWNVPQTGVTSENQQFTYTLTITRKVVTLAWTNTDTVYKSTDIIGAAVSNLETRGTTLDVVTVRVENKADNTAFSTTTAAGVYTAAAIELNGAQAGNYTLVGAADTEVSYTVKKLAVAKPTLDASAFGSVNFAGAQSSNCLYGNKGDFDASLLTAAVAAKLPASWFTDTKTDKTVDTTGANYGFDVATGALSYYSAGVYTVTFTLTESENYYFAGDGKDTDFGFVGSYTYAWTDALTVDRSQLAAPKLGASRAMQQSGTITDLSTLFVGTIDGAAYSVAYGTRTNGVCDPDSTSATQQGGTTGSAILGQYFAMLTASGVDAYNYVWIVEAEGESGYTGSSFITNITGGLPFHTAYTQENGARVFLYYAITASQVNAQFVLHGYTFGDNGTSATATLSSVIEFKNKAEIDGQVGGDAGYKSIKYEFTKDGVAVAESELVGGLPWNAGKYSVKITITFADEQMWQEWSGSYTFTVARREIAFAWTYGETQYMPGDTARVAYKGASYLPDIGYKLTNVPQKSLGDAAENNAPALKITASGDGLIAGESERLINVGDYVITLAEDGENENYTLPAECGLKFVINPKSIDIAAKSGIRHTYGDALDFAPASSYYDVTGGEIYARDGEIVAIVVLDGADSVVTDSKLATVTGTFYLVPTLVSGSVNSHVQNYEFTLSTQSKAALTVVKRAITVTVDTGVTTSVFGETPIDLNTASGVFAVSLTGGEGNAFPSGEVAGDVFSLSALDGAITITSATEVGSYPIALNYTVKGGANYEITFGTEYKYAITEADITVGTVTGYGPAAYDALGHDILSAAAATAVNGKAIAWHVRKAGGEYAEYTLSGLSLVDAEGNALEVKNVADSGTYEIYLSADSHNDSDVMEITVSITKKSVDVSVNISIFFGEKGPENFDGTGTLYKNTLIDLRAANGIYKVSGICESDLAAFNDVAAYPGFVSGSFTYGYGDKAYAVGSPVGEYPLVVTASALVSDNYEFVGKPGKLTVMRLPVLVVVLDMVGENAVPYKTIDPPDPTVTVTTDQVSAYDGIDTVVAIFDADRKNIITLRNPAIVVSEDGTRTTNNAGVYEITVQASANYSVPAGNYNGGGDRAKYEIAQIQNAIVEAGYSLFASAPSYTAPLTAESRSAWVYGDKTATNANGYDPDGRHALQPVSLEYKGLPVAIAIVRGGKTLAAATVAAGGDIKAALDGMFADIHAATGDGAFYAGAYTVTLDMAVSTNYKAFNATYYFRVARSVVEITPDALEITYGDDMSAHTYTYKVEGLAVNNGVNDVLSDVVTLEYASAYVAGYERGSVGKYDIVENTAKTNTALSKSANYDININTGEKALTVKPRAITIDIVDLHNYYNLLVLNSGAEDKYSFETASTYKFVLQSGAFVSGDFTEAVTVGVECEADVQNVFVLDSDALNARGTNNAGKYAIYLTNGAHYFSNVSGYTNSPNYDITIGEASFADVDAIPDAALQKKAGTFTVDPARIESELIPEFTSGTYDGAEKKYRVSTSLPKGPDGNEISVLFTARYVEYDDAWNALGEATSTAPVNVGKYSVTFVTDDPNYVANTPSQRYTINKRALSVTPQNVKNSLGGYRQDGSGYIFNGGTFTYTVVFGNLAGNELIGLDTAESCVTFDTIADDELKTAFTSFKAALGENTLSFDVRNAGRYTVKITLTDGSSKFLASNYTFEDGKDKNELTFTLTIVKQTLTVESLRSEIEYGAPLTDAARFGGFRFEYFVDNVSASSANTATKDLLDAEMSYGYLSFVNGASYSAPKYTTDYNAATSTWGTVYDIAFDKTCVVAYNFAVTTADTKNLYIVPRAITVTVNGIESGNTYAQCEYTGMDENHNPHLAAAFEAHRASFLDVSYGDGFAKSGSLVSPAGNNKGNNALYAVTLAMSRTRDFSAGEYDVVAAQDKNSYPMYVITFEGAAKYRINRKTLYIAIGEYKADVSYAALNKDFGVPYGRTLAIGRTFIVRYDGWANNEGNADGSRTASVAGRVTIGFSALDASNNAYVAWESNAGSVFTVSPTFVEGNANSYHNYVIEFVTAKLTVEQLTVSATAQPVVYGEGASGYNNGVSGKAHDVSLEFVGVDHALAGAYSPLTLGTAYTAVYNTTTANASAAKGAPIKAGQYTAMVTLKNTGNYKFVGGAYTATFDHVVYKQVVDPFRWNDASVSLTIDHEGDYTNTVLQYRSSLMTVVNFVLGTDNIESYTASDDGLTVTFANIGRYSLTVAFNAAASVNYCWDDSAKDNWGANGENKTIDFTVGSDEMGSVLVITATGDSPWTDWTYNDGADHTPTYELTAKINGAPISTTAVVMTYVAAPSSISASGGVGAITSTHAGYNTVRNLAYSGAIPQNAGWYIVHAAFVGNAEYTASDAYYMFYISRKAVNAPTIATTDRNYNGDVLTATLDYDTREMYIVDFDGGYSTTTTGATLTVTDAATYTVKLALRNTATVVNYEWAASANAADGIVSVVWKVDPAAENDIIWDAGNIYNVTYGESYRIAATAEYSPFVTVEYVTASAGDDPASVTSGWSTDRPYGAGVYHVRALCAATDNYPEGVSYMTLTIEKAVMYVTASGTLTYGDKFDKGSFAYALDPDLASEVKVGTLSYVLVDETAVANKDSLDVRSGGYDLTLAADGSGEVLGITSANYKVIPATEHGKLVVSPRRVRIRIGDLDSVYGDEVKNANTASVVALGTVIWADGTDIKQLLGITLSTAAVKGSDRGVYPIVGAWTNGNFDVTFEGGSYTVNVLKIAVTIAMDSGVYGGKLDPAEVVSIVGVNSATPDRELGADALSFAFRYAGVTFGGDSYESGTTVPTKAGNYSVEITAILDNEVGNYEFDLTAGSISKAFTIDKMTVDPAKLVVPHKTYNGKAQQPEIEDDEYDVGDEPFYTVLEHDDFVDAGTYTFVLRLADTDNYAWSRSGEEKEMTFVIDKADNVLTATGSQSEPIVTVKSWSYGQYDEAENGAVATVKFVEDKNVVFEYAYSADGTLPDESAFSTAVPRDGNAGKYYVRVTVAESKNVNAFVSEAFPFEILKIVVSAPTLETNADNLSYTGDTLTARVAGYDDVLMGISFGSITFNNSGVYLNAVGAGEYSAVVSLKYGENYRWADGTALDADGNALVTWTVARKKVALPTPDTAKLRVNGEMLYYFPNGFDSSIMAITGNSYGYSGRFTAAVILLDTDNYEWADGSTAPLPFDFEIVGTSVAFIVIMCVLAACIVAALAVCGVLCLRYDQRLKLENIAATGAAPATDGATDPDGDGDGNDEAEDDDETEDGDDDGGDEENEADDGDDEGEDE